jgi:hypothetical protein
MHGEVELVGPKPKEEIDHNGNIDVNSSIILKTILEI